MIDDELFGIPYTRKVDYVKDYCKSIIDDVFANLQWLTTVNYQGCLERIANEVYFLKLEKYKVSLTIDTFYDRNARLTVDILPEYKISNIEKSVDLYLEKLKSELKNRNHGIMEYVNVEEYLKNLNNDKERLDQENKVFMGYGI